MIETLESERNGSVAKPSAPTTFKENCIKPLKSASVVPTIGPAHLLPVPNEKEKLKNSEFTPNVPQFLTVSPSFETPYPTIHPSEINKARHSIDIRSLPSYIARKRQSLLDSKIIDTLIEGK